MVLFIHASRRLVHRVTLLALLCAGCAAQAQDVELDHIRAVVNEDVVLNSEVQTAINFFKLQSAEESQSLPPDNIIEERLLQQLIDQKVREQHARQLGISIDPGTVNRAIEQIASNNNMDTLQFRDALNTQGLDYDQFRDNIEQELLLQRLIERDVQARTRVSQQEIDDYVEAAKNDAAEQQRYRINHILISAPPSASEEEFAAASERAATVLAQLQADEDFAQVAAANSDGARALQGGDLGWRTLQELPDFLSSTVSGLEVGELAGPLRSDNGLHIVQLADIQSNDLTIEAETLARHIYINGDDTGIQASLADARRRIQGGTPFGEVAANLSQDPNSADNGGELPWFSQGQMPPAMEQMADSLEVDEISQPFRTQFGWHLMQVLDRREREVGDEALRQQAGNALLQRKVEQETQRWSQQLRDESYIEVRS